MMAHECPSCGKDCYCEPGDWDEDECNHDCFGEDQTGKGPRTLRQLAYIGIGTGIMVAAVLLMAATELGLTVVGRRR